jgi:GH24 family phage-related lysozyme (muramidase)
MATLSSTGLDLILEFEGFDPKPSWPKASSGVTIGFGYDLGYVSIDEFASDWGSVIAEPDELAALIKCVGLTGLAAKAAITNVADIRVSKTASRAVFLQRSMPKAEFNTRKAFPRYVELCDNAYSALVSLVFNRGGSMTDSLGDPLQRRREMREIRDTVASNTLSNQQKLVAIAKSLRSMKRIWQGQGVAGLIRRRESEAVLVETCKKG